MLGGDLQPLAAPDALHAVLTDRKAAQLEHRGDAPVAIAAVSAGKGEDLLRERVFIGSLDRVVALGAPRLTQNAAGLALRDPVLADRVIHGLPTSLGA